MVFRVAIYRIKKQSIVRDQIPLHNFVVYSARGVEPRLADNELAIVGKLSAFDKLAALAGRRVESCTCFCNTERVVSRE